MDSSTQQPKPDRKQLARPMKVLFLGCWAALAAGFIAVASAGHMSPLGLVSLAGALAALAAVVFVLFQSLQKWTRDSNFELAGKSVGLILAFAALSILFSALTVYVQ